MIDAIAVDSELSDALLPLPPLENTVTGAFDYKGHPALRSKHGRWRSACFIIAVEMAERIAYLGVASNLITYLTRELGQSTAIAAANVNVWIGVALFLPVLGAIVADSFTGKYYTIVASSVLYILGLSLLTVSAMLPSSASCPNHERNTANSPKCPNPFQMTTFFVALYLVASAQAGYKPCVQAFGADQFDGEDPNETKSKSSFFNWWYFGVSMGGLLGIAILSYIQDNLSWALGFGIPSLIMSITLVIFLCGTPTYRYIAKHDESPCKRISDFKSMFGLFPIWATSLTFAIFYAQTTTFFTKQGATLDRSMGPSFVLPPASLQSVIGITMLVVLPFYDQVFVPVARNLTGNPTGIPTLGRVGIGMLVSVVCMAIATFVEKKRLNTALEHGLIDLPNATIPMSILWLLPQYVFAGIADALTMVGLQEFFYDQVPKELRSVGISLYLSVFGIGSLLSSVLVSIVDNATSRGGRESWFSDNLNRARLDYFYWVIAGISALGLGLFIFCAKLYANKKSTCT